MQEKNPWDDDSWKARAEKDRADRIARRKPISYTTEIILGLILLLFPLPLAVSLLWLEQFSVLSGIAWGVASTLWIVGLALLRERLLRRQLWRGEEGCLACGSDRLQRVRRRWYQRLPRLLGVGTRAFRCRECGWQGVLLIN